MFLTVCFCNYIVTIYISYLYLLVFLLSAGHVMVLRLFSQCFAVSLKCILLLVLFDLHHAFITFGSIKYHVFLSNFCMVVVSLTIVKPSVSYLNHRVLWFYNYNQQDPTIFYYLFLNVSSISPTIPACSSIGWQYLKLKVQLCAPDDGRRIRPKHVEPFRNK